jgi:ATP-dependent Clp protease adapter protein ClpS
MPFDRFNVSVENAANQMRTSNINYTADDYTQNDFLTYLLKQSFLENGEPSTVFMRF